MKTMSNEMQTYHVPVLLEESIEGMNLSPKGIYVDVTFGGGGHSKEILRQMDQTSHLYSFDQDEVAAYKSKTFDVDDVFFSIFVLVKTI